MRRAGFILVLLTFLGLGTGATGYLHNLQHISEDAAIAAEAKAAGLPAPVHHDDSNCAIHAQIHSPLVMTGWVPLLACLGLWVAFLTELPQRPIYAARRLKLDCRGPPSCC